MKKAVLLILVTVITLLAIEARLEKSDNLFLNRHKDRSYLSQATSLCKDVLAEDPGNVEVLWRMSRIYLALGHDCGCKQDRLNYYEKSVSYAEKAKKADPSSPNALLFYGASLSCIMKEKGLMSAVSEGMKVKASFEKAIQVDPGHAFSLGALGIWYFTAPAVAGGSLDKAIYYLKKSVQADPNYSLAYLYLGKAYLKKKDNDAARKYLNRCVAITSPTTPNDFYTSDKPQACKLLEQIDN